MKNYLNEIKLSIKIGLMVLIGLSAFEASAEIVQASSVNDIKAYTSQFESKDTLVLFDLDYVLFAPRDRVLRYTGEENNYRSTTSKLYLKIFKEKMSLLVRIKCQWLSI